MQKNLYLVGLDHDAFAYHNGNISHLLNRRNGIAHGLEREGIRASDYDKLEKSVFKIMDDLMTMIMTAIALQLFKK